jgi:predicted NBD/HSP70 family sugar kinase
MIPSRFTQKGFRRKLMSVVLALELISHRPAFALRPQQLEDPSQITVLEAALKAPITQPDLGKMAGMEENTGEEVVWTGTLRELAPELYHRIPSWQKSKVRMLRLDYPEPVPMEDWKGQIELTGRTIEIAGLKPEPIVREVINDLETMVELTHPGAQYEIVERVTVNWIHDLATGAILLEKNPQRIFSVTIRMAQSQAGMEETPKDQIVKEVQAKYGTDPYAVGVRVGGNNVSAGLVNAQGEVETRVALEETNWRRIPAVLEWLGLDPTQPNAHSEEALNQAVLALVPIPEQGKRLTDDERQRASAIADQVTKEVVRHVVALIQNAQLPVENLKLIHIAVPAPVDSKNGIVGDVIPAANIPGYVRYPLANRVKEEIQKELGVEVLVEVENDAPSGFKGEHIAGQGKGFERVATFIWGTGMNGTDFAGRWFELGHALVGEPWPDGKWHYTLHDVRLGRPSLAPNQLELEQRLGGGAGLPTHWLTPAGFSDPRMVTERAREGDSKAIELIQDAGTEFGRALAVVFANDYEETQTILERFILVSGIGEHFGEGVRDAQGRDLLIGAIQDGLQEELVKRFGIPEEVANRMTEAIVRSEWDARREIAAAAVGLRAILGQEKQPAGMEEVDAHLASVVLSIEEFKKAYPDRLYLVGQNDTEVVVFTVPSIFHIYSDATLSLPLYRQLAQNPVSGISFDIQTDLRERKRFEAPGIILADTEFGEPALPEALPLRVVALSKEEAERLTPAAWIFLAIHRHLAVQDVLSMNLRFEVFWDRQGNVRAAIFTSA